MFNGQHIECLYLPSNKQNIISIHQLHELGYGCFTTINQITLIKLDKVPAQVFDLFYEFCLKDKEKEEKNAIVLPYEKEGMPYVRLDSKRMVPKQEHRTYIEDYDNKGNWSINYLDGISDDNDMDMDNVSDRIPIFTVSKLDYSKIDTHLDKVPEDSIFRTHCALGHMHYRKMKELGLSLSASQIKRLKKCKTCKAVKFTLKPTTQQKDHTSTAPFEHLHMDTAGPIRVLGKPWYVVLLIDDFSRYLKVFVVRKKSEVKDVVEEYLDAESKNRGICPRFITTDKGNEFKGLGFDFTDHWDIRPTHVKQIPYLNVAPTGNKEYNGLAERCVRTLKDLQNLITSHLDPVYREQFFRLSFQYAAELYNRSPHTSINNEFPYGKYFKRKPKLYSEEDKEEKDQYLSSQPAHLFLNIKRTLPELPMFLEDGIAPFIYKGKTTLEECFFIGYDSNDCLLVMRKPTEKNKRVHLYADKTTQFIRYGTFDLHRGLATKSVNEMYSAFVSKVPFTKAEFLFLRSFNENCDGNNFSVNNVEWKPDNDKVVIVPKNFKEALLSAEWLAAIEKEIQSFMGHSVYKTATQHRSATYLQTFWLFSRKLNGTAKARLITINPKTVGTRDKDSSSPVVQSTTIAMMFVLFTMRTGLNFSVYDISTAFLNSVVPADELYLLRTPLGFGKHFQSKYVQMLRYCYGLNVSPLRFHETLCKAYGEKFQVSPFDQCFHSNADKDLFIAHHVDDLLVLSRDPKVLETSLEQQFTLKKQDRPDAYLGCDLHLNEVGISMSLSTYLEKAVEQLDPILRKAIKTRSIKPFTSEAANMSAPLQPTQEHLLTHITKIENENVLFPDNSVSECYQLEPLKEGEFEASLPFLSAPTTEQRKNKTRTKHSKLPHEVDTLFSQESYRSLVGIINYIATKGRFDIQVYASILAQYSTMPSEVEYRQAVHLLQYCYSTRNSGCYYKRATHDIPLDSEVLIEVYTDASDKKDNSQGGYIILVNNHYVDSKSYRISCFTASSFEAEVLALRVGVIQGLHLVSNFRELGYRKIRIQVYCDNYPVLLRLSGDQVKNKVTYNNCLAALRWYTKHQNVRIDHVKGIQNPADLLTKPLTFGKLKSLLEGPILKQTFNLILDSKNKKSNTIH